jgi:hypothetical protein
MRCPVAWVWRRRGVAAMFTPNVGPAKPPPADNACCQSIRILNQASIIEIELASEAGFNKASVIRSRLKMLGGTEAGVERRNVRRDQTNVKHTNIFARLRLLFTLKLVLSTDERLSRHARNWACPKTFRQGHTSAQSGA